MKKWVFSILVIALAFRGEIYAAQKSTPGTFQEPTTQEQRLGAGAYDGYQSSVKWGVAVGGLASAAVVFAIIMILASSDPSLFSHDHSGPVH